MADRILYNQGEMDGTYADMPFQESKSSILEVTLAELPFEKSADQKIWFSGPLTVTFTIDNTEGAGPLDLIVIRDLLDNTKFAFDDESVIIQITDTLADPISITTLVEGTDYTMTYTPETVDDPEKDLLVFTFLAGGAGASIPVGSIVTISFQGEKVPV